MGHGGGGADLPNGLMSRDVSKEGLREERLGGRRSWIEANILRLS